MKLITETIEDVQVLTEEKNGRKDYKIKGVFMQADIKNRNGRIYPVETLAREVRRYTKEFIDKRRASFKKSVDHKYSKEEIDILKKIPKIDFIYIPKYQEIYKGKTKPKIVIKKSDKILCAKFRKGHFEGVLDVMDRLTNLIKPNKIYMRKKDYQQLFLVKNYIEKKYKTKIIGCKTIRNTNKLALSSRNFLFKKDELKQLEIISKKFLYLRKNIINHKNIKKFLWQSKKDIEKLFKIKIEYLENRNIKNLKISNKHRESKIFLSYYFKGVRLIDNF